jgi:hypothetical protein
MSILALTLPSDVPAGMGVVELEEQVSRVPLRR